MNKQAKANGGRGIEWTDYTWNPIAGCYHACQWTMPDGSIANCYAEDVANRIAGRSYPHGFEYHYWKPEILDEPLKLNTPAKIFVGSMADVFGHWVREDQILQVLKVCRGAPQHTFQFLTKNPRRVRMFTDLIPRNCWIGASTPPDYMWNRKLTQHRRNTLLGESLKALFALHREGVTTWMSAEPITIDIGLSLKEFFYTESERPFDWLVIGAASNGKTLYAPDHHLVTHAVHYADQYGVQVFFKGNLKSLPWAAENWREDFPQLAAGQGELF